MKPLLAIILLIVCVDGNSQAFTLPDDVVKAIEERIEKGLNRSIAVGIVTKNGVAFYNYGTTGHGGYDVHEHTIYEIGSITKVFTGTLLAHHVVHGNMKLDDPIRKYLPEAVKVPVRGAAEITLGSLSDHTSSLPRMPFNFMPADLANPYRDYTREKMFAFLSMWNLTRDVGSRYEYSNFAQGLLGEILAIYAGRPYETLMIQTIAGPLGMNETRVVLDESMKNNLARPHRGGEEVKNWDLAAFAGAGGIRSSTADMIKFIAAYLGLQSSSLREAMILSMQPRHDKAGDGTRVGLGWHLSAGSRGDIIWHNGATGGYWAFAGFVRETGTGVVILSNSNESIDDIGLHLLNPESRLKEID